MAGVAAASHLGTPAARLSCAGWRRKGDGGGGHAGRQCREMWRNGEAYDGMGGPLRRGLRHICRRELSALGLRQKMALAGKRIRPVAIAALLQAKRAAAKARHRHQ